MQGATETHPAWRPVMGQFTPFIWSVMRTRESLMLRWAVTFFVIALVAAVLGFGGIAAGATEIAKILFFVFLIIFVVTLILGLRRR